MASPELVSINPAVPPIILDAPQLRYDMAELLSRCDANAGLDLDGAEWLDAPEIGRELL